MGNDIIHTVKVLTNEATSYLHMSCDRESLVLHMLYALQEVEEVENIGPTTWEWDLRYL